MGSRDTSKKRKTKANCLVVTGFVLVAIILLGCFSAFINHITSDGISDHSLKHRDKDHGHFVDDDDASHDYGNGDKDSEHYVPMGKCPYVTFRSSDGSDRAATNWKGVAGGINGRYVQPGYMGQGREFDKSLPSPRKISNVLCKQAPNTPKHKQYSGAVWSFGQFIDHVITISPNECTSDPFHMDITGDEHFDPHHRGANITMQPSHFHTDTLGNRHPINKITSWVDGNALYGSDSDRTAYLRRFEYGELNLHSIAGKGEYLPKNLVGAENEGGNYNRELWLAGDTRANEQSPLTSWHILFLREHNYQARRLRSIHHEWDDECLFQKAKQIVVAELQKIVYEEFLPTLIGEELPEYKGYDHSADARIFTEFSGAAYRLHSLVQDSLDIRSADTGQYITTILLKDAFFEPTLIEELGIDGVLLGLFKSKSESLDLSMVDSLRQFLFFKDGKPLDLAVLNIMRGRMVGLPYYSELREKLGFGKLERWSDFDVDEETLNKFQHLYGVKGYENIDLWVGLMAERPRGNDLMGPVLKKIIVDQFCRLRDTDVYYWKVDKGLTKEERRYIENSSLRSIVQRNTEIRAEHLQDNLFKFE